MSKLSATHIFSKECFLMILKSVTDSFGRARRHEFDIVFSQEERFWLDQHGCYTQDVRAKSRKDCKEMEFFLYSGNNYLQLRCKPEDFFTSLENELRQVPRKTIEVKADLPGMNDEEFV